MTDTEFNYPFPETPITPICDDDVCPSPSPSSSPIPEYCGGSLVNSSANCPPCAFEDEDGSSGVYFLGCQVAGFNGKLGFNGSESSVSVELVASGATSNTECSLNCTPAQLGCPPEPSEQPNTYTGSIGHIYTFSIGSFCFRGILSNHQYVESSSGYRYNVTLTDGRQILSNVAVIMHDTYVKPPDGLTPNLINILYNIEPSVQCNDDGRCKDFGKSGKGHKGILLKKVLEGIDGKQCQVPISAACLTINVSALIDRVADDYRISETQSDVLSIITLACEEIGYDFYVGIVGYEIKVFLVNNKNKTYDIPAGNDPPLFDFLNTLSQNNYMIDREYGQELTFHKSKKMVIGDNWRYLTIIEPEPSNAPCSIDDPGDVGSSPQEAVNANSVGGCDTI